MERGDVGDAKVLDGGFVGGVLVVVLGAAEGGVRVGAVVGFDGVRALDGRGFDGGATFFSGIGCVGTGIGVGSWWGISGVLTLGSEEPFAVEVAAAGGSDEVGSGFG